jgi:hypothetical protein
MKVFVNKHDREGKIVGRKEVNAEILEERKRTFLVRLPDGNVIIRKKGRDLPDAQQPKDSE